MKNNLNIQIIIPILNPEKSFFSNIIPRLHSQTIHPDILIINSGSAIPKGDYEILTIDKKEFNHANTRNLAMNYAADFYLFMTQDAMPYENTLIENLLRAFADPDIVVAYARQMPYPDADPIEVFTRTANYPEHSMVKSKDDFNKGIKGSGTFYKLLCYNALLHNEKSLT